MIKILICVLAVVAAHLVLYWYLKREHWQSRGFYNWYDKKILRDLQAELLLGAFSQAAELPPASGKTIKWRRYCLKSE